MATIDISDRFETFEVKVVTNKQEIEEFVEFLEEVSIIDPGKRINVKELLIRKEQRLLTRKAKRKLSNANSPKTFKVTATEIAVFDYLYKAGATDQTLYQLPQMVQLWSRIKANTPSLIVS